MPNVLFTSHSPAISGAEVVLLELLERGEGASAFVFQQGPLADALAARGVSVTASRFGGRLSAVRRDRSLLRALPLVWPIAAIIVELARLAPRYDIVYANSQKAFILSAIATAVSKRPLIWHLHDIPDRSHFGAAQLKLQVGLANRRAARVVVPSRAVADGFVAAGGRADLVRIVPNGVTAQEAGDLASGAALRAMLGLRPGPVIGIFSRLAVWKGQHVALRALATLPDVSLVIAGDALFGEEAYAAHLKHLAGELGVADRVFFLGQRSDVAELMRAVDIVVHPSTSPEPFGLTIVESMFAGTPVVATALGAVPDILDGGAAGTMVAPGDSDALADAIEHLLSHPAERQAKTALALQRARDHYTARRMRSTIFGLIGGVGVEAS